MLPVWSRTSRRGGQEFVSSSTLPMDVLHRAFARTAARRRHLDEPNLLRSLTLVINGVPGGINLGQGVCDLDSPAPLVKGAIASIGGEDRQLYTPYAGLPELREAIAAKLEEMRPPEPEPAVVKGESDGEEAERDVTDDDSEAMS